jgi:hypothetical protein
MTRMMSTNFCRSGTERNRTKLDGEVDRNQKKKSDAAAGVEEVEVTNGEKKTNGQKYQEFPRLYRLFCTDLRCHYICVKRKI